MKSSKIFVVLVIALLALGGFTATLAQDPTATPAPTATFVPSAEGTLTIWADNGRVAAIEAAGAKFTEQYSIPVRVPR